MEHRFADLSLDAAINGATSALLRFWTHARISKGRMVATEAWKGLCVRPGVSGE